ncbi:MAG: DUF1254 domain-containing protein [Mycobacterium sp.]|nr:DUF1254 domain-containing protein [Mycobacterium sp.]
MSVGRPASQRWVQASVVAAGLGAAALLGGAGIAVATPGDEAGSDGPSARSDSPASAATPRARTQRTAAVVRNPRPAAAVPAASPSPSAGAESLIRSGGSPRMAQRAAAKVSRHALATPSPAGYTPTAAVPGAAIMADCPPGPIMSAILAAQAYIYGYPLMEYERVRSEAPSLNTLINLTSFANPDVDPIWKAIGGGKRPNVDTFYSLAELDLSGGPVVLSIPDMGDRYFSFQLTDPYTNVTGYIGSRTTGPGPGTYAITWTGGPAVTVPGAVVVEVPYASMMMLGRTLAGNEPDQQSAVSLIRQYTLTPTGPTGPNDAVLPANASGIAYLNGISDAMTQNPPPAADDPELAKLARIGVGVGLQVADAGLGPLSLLAADLSVKLTAALLPSLAQLQQWVSALQNHGWAIPNANIGDFGTDYLFRAGVAEVGLVANTQDEAMYEAGLLDSWYLPLFTLLPFKTYTLHFAAGQTPPADAFWSITVYDGNGNLVPNAEGRYSVSSSRPEELVYRPDGSVDIIFSRTDPGDPGANWLMAPLGSFSAYLRMYVPEQSALDREWLPPPIRPSWRLFG